MSFTIAIIGRPNVGKSTLFNRLVGQKLALVDDTPGVTRDRREGQGKLGDLEFTLIDTAGLDEGAKGSLTARMQEQTETAIALADALMFVVDARAGLTPNDRGFARTHRGADRSGGRAVRPASDPCRHRRTSECRQVDAGQPADRRGAAADRAGSGHHP